MINKIAHNVLIKFIKLIFLYSLKIKSLGLNFNIERIFRIYLQNNVSLKRAIS